jgi:site-specific recombinase XerD
MSQAQGDFNRVLEAYLAKGRQNPSIELNHKACKALAAYLTVRLEAGHTALFMSQFKQPISTRAIQHRITKYLKEAGITGASVHTLQHTMAIHHLIQGTGLRTGQSILGH